MSPEQIQSKLPRPLRGVRIMPDAEAMPQIRIEINCICGNVLEAATYLDRGLIKAVVAPCLRCQRVTA